MPAGLTVYNDDNILQIDENYKNWVLVLKQTLTSSSADMNTWLGSRASVTANAKKPCVFFNSSVPVVPVGAVKSGDSWTFHFQLPTTTSATFTVYVFDEPPTTPIGTYGLTVFTASGEVAFDSGFKYMRVVESVQSSSYTPIPDIILPIGKTYALGVGSFTTSYLRLTEQQPGGLSYGVTQDFFGIGGLNTGGNNVRVQQQTLFSNYALFSSNPGNAAVGFGAISIMVIDVTGY